MMRGFIGCALNLLQLARPDPQMETRRRCERSTVQLQSEEQHGDPSQTWKLLRERAFVKHSSGPSNGGAAPTLRWEEIRDRITSDWRVE
jgi:hypothetical protein